jgi:hypothetical protein
MLLAESSQRHVRTKLMVTEEEEKKKRRKTKPKMTPGKSLAIPTASDIIIFLAALVRSCMHDTPSLAFSSDFKIRAPL